MSCHRAIATDKEEIRKLTRHYEEKRPVLWIRVYSLPEHVYFSHKRHAKAGVDCAECHGMVGAMIKIRRVGSLEMGWCVSCHRVKGAPRDCATCHKKRELKDEAKGFIADRGGFGGVHLCCL